MADAATYQAMPQNDTGDNKNGSVKNDKNMNEAATSKQSTTKVADSGVVRLERNLGLFSAITIIVGNIIGSGIFLTPSNVLENAGSVGMSLVVWIGAGVFSVIGALCFLELGTTIVQSGAEYIYIKQIFGDLPAFIVLWVTMTVVAPVSRILTCMTFANYILQPFYPNPDCRPPDEVISILSVACMSKYYFIVCLHSN